MDIHFKKENLILTIDGQEHIFPLSQVSEKLAQASKVERETCQVSPSGYGIHWPLIDEDLSIDALLGITHNYEKKAVGGKSSVKGGSRRLQPA